MTTYTITEAQRQQLLDVSLSSLSNSSFRATKLLQSLTPLATPSPTMPFVPWSKEAEMMESWAAPSTSQPLTDEQLDAILVEWPKNLGPKAFARAIEAAHGIALPPPAK